MAKKKPPASGLGVKILKYGDVDWRRCKWIQPDDLKEQTVAQREKLKESLKRNGFATPFMVWASGKTTYILDGHHRQRALHELEKEGCAVPPKLPALWIDAQNMAEAKKLVLVYSSRYAEFQPDTLREFITDLDVNALIAEIDIPDIELDDLLNPVEEPEEADPPARKRRKKDEDQLRLVLCVEFESEDDMQKLYDRLTEEGYECKLIA